MFRIEGLADRLLVFEPGARPRLVLGGYAAYRSDAQRDSAQRAESTPQRGEGGRAGSGRDRGGNRRERQRRERARARSFEKLERDIMEREEQIAALEQRMLDPELARDHEALRSLGEQHAKLRRELEVLNAEWERQAEQMA
ncbi:MAG: hypothetical protein D6776_10760 [Planctomycetota bacterium]|nr:MAG: hypothetical protein D6776_10760 [Planctomycetota bacterium]